MEDELRQRIIAVLIYTGEMPRAAFLQEIEGSSLFRRIIEGIIELTDMVKTSFMSGLYEVCSASPEMVFDAAWMEVEEDDDDDDEEGHGDLDVRKVACTTQLGVQRSFSCLSSVPDGAREATRKVLVKPVAVLEKVRATKIIPSSPR